MSFYVAAGLTAILGGSSAWSPLNFSGTLGWWKGDDLSGLTDGASITTWPSVPSGNDFGNYSVHPTKPTKITLSTKVAAQFVTASSQGMAEIATTSNIFQFGVGLIAVVVRLNGNPTPTGTLLHYDGGAWIFGDQAEWWGIAAYTTSGVPHFVLGIFDTAYRERDFASTANLPHLLLMYRDSGGTLHASLDGGTEITIASGNPGNLGQVVTIGSSQHTGTGTAVPLNGYIFEAMISNDSSSPTDRTSLISYLKTKYSIP